MTLDAGQKARTADELRQNFILSGLSVEALADRLGWSVEQVDEALEVRAEPRQVWALRDALEHAARDAGREPVPFSVLTEHARHAAREWFGID